jgi:hypothetical protein
MRKVGDYEWRQLSVWDFAPANCIEAYVKRGDHILHFYLLRVNECVTDNHYRTEAVESIDAVPDAALKYRNGEIYIRKNNVATKLESSK